MHLPLGEQREERRPLAYILHSGKLYGTERMALATLETLARHWRPVLIAPKGPALAEARRLGIESIAASGPLQIARALNSLHRGAPAVATITTSVIQAFVALLVDRCWGRQSPQVHVIHGGDCERKAYSRKHWLCRTRVQLVAVSTFVWDCLARHGVPRERVHVIENFLSKPYRDSISRREASPKPIRDVWVVSRLDANKRVDLLLKALDLSPELASLNFHIYGTGSEFYRLRDEASANHPNVIFHGFHRGLINSLHRADLYLHTCPDEPFGLAILEARAALVPVLVPDRGGARNHVRQGVSGMVYRAEDPRSLAEELRRATRHTAAELGSMTFLAFSEHSVGQAAEIGAMRYQQLLQTPIGDLPHVLQPKTCNPG